MAPPPAAAGSPPPANQPAVASTEALQSEVASLRRRLAKLEAQRARVRRRRERVDAQREELRAWAAAWHGRVNAAAAAVTVARGRLRAAEREAAAVGERLATLGRTHVLDDAYFIWHAGPFVTINGLRLGRLPAVANVRFVPGRLCVSCIDRRPRSISTIMRPPSFCHVLGIDDDDDNHGRPPHSIHLKTNTPTRHRQVDWAEVNGALGLAALLVSAAAERGAYRFRQHQLLPMGSFPRIAAAAAARPAALAEAPTPPSRAAVAAGGSSGGGGGGGGVHNLYYEDTGFSLNPFRRQNFNRALQAFLRCVQELGAFAEARDPTLRLPHRIAADGATVGGLAIVFAPGSEEGWTRALKFLMTDVKWLVAWSAKHTG
jgi:beclin 1